ERSWCAPFCERISTMARVRDLMTDDRGKGRAAPDSGTPATAAPLAAAEPAGGWLQQYAEPCREPVVGGGGKVNYVGFASDRSKAWDALRQLYPGVKVGDPFIGFSDGQYQLVDPLKFHLVSFRQSWVRRDDSYDLEAVMFRDPGRQAGWSEEFLAFCVVL